MIAPKRVLAVAAVAAMAGLSACGSSTSAVTSPSLSASVPSAPAAGTILTAAQVKSLVKAAGANVTSVHETITISTSAADITGNGDLVNGPNGVTMQMDLTVPQLGAMQMRLVDKGFYLKMNLPQLAGKWIKIDLSNKNSPLGQMLGSLTSMSPTQMFDQYAGGLIGGTFIGTDATGDHYQVNVDTAAALRNLPPSMAGNTLIEQGMKNLPKTLKLNVWIKGGLLQKTVTDMGATGDVTVVLSNYGETVNVVAPPTSEVTALPGLG
jgi:hypothetical protein